MKNHLIFLLLLFNLQSMGQNPFIFDTAAIKTIALTEQKNFFLNKFSVKNKMVNNYDIKYTCFKWEIDPNILFIKGGVTTYFITTQVNVSNISFDLSHFLEIDSVRFHNSLISFSHSIEDELILNLPTSLPLDHIDSVEIFYHGVPNNSGLGSFMKSEHNGVSIISTLSEPYGAKEWFPCKNDLTDKIDSIDIFITSPIQYKAASNGLLVCETINGDKRISHWKHKYPIATYLIAIAVTNYAVYSDYYHYANDSLQILNYVYPEDSANNRQISPTTLFSLSIFDSLFETYPFIKERYGHAQFSASGGMEHQTMTFLGYFSSWVIWHELAHQWFGDMITCGSWHDIWLNEGFATYLNGLCHEKTDHGYWWLPWKQYTLNEIVSMPDGSVYVEDTTSVNRIFDSRLSYHKGAYILHQLRWILGDEKFYQSIKNYINDPSIRFRYARSSDLIRHFEETCDTSLTEYFNCWLYGQGYPSYQIECIKENGENINIKVNQSQSHYSVSFFKMHLPLKFKNNVGQDTVIVLKNNYNGQEFNISLPFEPDSVFFDPDLWLISKNNTISLSVKDYPLNNYELDLFPNPANDILYVKTSNIHPDKIEILNMVGMILDCKYIIDNQSNINFVDISKLDDGIYFVKAYYGKSYISRKFTKISL